MPKLKDQLQTEKKKTRKQIFTLDSNENIMLEQCRFINEHLGYEFRRNIVRCIIEYNLNGEGWKDLQDNIVQNIWTDFQLNEEFEPKNRPSLQRLNVLIDSRLLAYPFDAIKEFFDSLKWDKKDHISALANTVKITDDIYSDTKASQHWNDLLRRWLLNCVACGLGKGANHVMLTLISSQGKGKTTWINKLCPEDLSDYHHSGHIDPTMNNKDTCDLLAEKFLINIDDQLTTLFGKDFNSLKSIITTSFVNNRKSYDKRSARRVRIGNFAGSVNARQIFHDWENRRYLTFECESIDSYHKVNINQVWAQAYEIFKTGERFFFNAHDIITINAINESYSVTTAEMEWFLKMFTPLNSKTDVNGVYMQSNEITAAMQKCSGLRVSNWKLCNIVFKRLKLESEMKRIDNGPRYVYFVRKKYGEADGRIVLIDQADN